MAGGQDISACPSSWVLQTCHHCSGDKGQCGNNDAWPTMTNADCRASINGDSVVSVHYDATNCAMYNCADNTRHDGGDVWQSWATCNSDCTYFSVSLNLFQKVAASETLYASNTLGLSACMRWCFETPLCYTLSWNLENNCRLYTECGTTCDIEGSLDLVMKRTCIGRKYNAYLLFCFLCD